MIKNKFWKSIIEDERFKLKEGYPDFNLGTISVICLCIILLIIITFTKFNLPVLNLFSPYDTYRGENATFLSNFSYIAQVPAVFFIAALLGPVAGMLTIFLYILAGLIGLPVFSSGGGILYFFKPGFGYLLGFFPAVFFVSNIMKNKKIKYRLLKATLAGLICVHFVGVTYLNILMFFQGEQLFLILSWFWLLTGMQFLYDFIFGIIAIILGRIMRKVLSIVTDWN